MIQTKRLKRREKQRQKPNKVKITILFEGNEEAFRYHEDVREKLKKVSKTNE